MTNLHSGQRFSRISSQQLISLLVFILFLTGFGVGSSFAFLVKAVEDQNFKLVDKGVVAIESIETKSTPCEVSFVKSSRY